MEISQENLCRDIIAWVNVEKQTWNLSKSTYAIFPVILLTDSCFVWNRHKKAYQDHQRQSIYGLL